jgi:hypothetical protein
MGLSIGIEFLVGKGGTAGQGMLGSLEVQGFLEFLIAEASRILKGQMLLVKRTVGDGEDELAVVYLLVDHPVGVLTPVRFQLKPEVLDLNDGFLSGLGGSGPRHCESAGRGQGAWLVLKLLDVFSLQALRALGDVEFHRLTFGERPESFRLDGGVMHKDVISGSALDESIALRVVEPLHDTLFSIHIVTVFLFLFEISSFRSRDRSPRTKKATKSMILRPPTLRYSVTKTDQAPLLYTHRNYCARENIHWAERAREKAKVFLRRSARLTARALLPVTLPLRPRAGLFHNGHVVYLVEVPAWLEHNPI